MDTDMDHGPDGAYAETNENSPLPMRSVAHTQSLNMPFTGTLCCTVGVTILLLGAGGHDTVYSTASCILYLQLYATVQPTLPS